MSKEAKLAKKEAKAAKKAAKIEKGQAASYAKLVKSIEKKNAKAEKKANKKGKPFEPVAIPTQEEAFAAAPAGGKVKKIILMIILILLIWYIIYFLVMFHNYVAPTLKATAPEQEETSSSEPAVYDRYENPHDITTTPNYSVSEAKAMLKQILHDDWKVLGYNSDPSSGSINYTSNIVTINNQDCYVFTAGSKTYAVSITLSSAYVKTGSSYTPITFQGTDLLF